MNKQILNLTAMLLLPVALLALAGCSTTPKDQTAVATGNAAGNPAAIRGGVVIDVVTGTATVQSVNASDRTVVLLHLDGSTSTYECGPEVRNFDQIKAGDQVTATVGEELALVLVPGGSVPPSAGQASALVRAPLGAKPGGKLVDTVAFSAKVTAVNAMNREVTLQTVDGLSKTVKVGPDINLAKVHPGDDVGVRLTRAFAISVEAPVSGAAPAVTK